MCSGCLLLLSLRSWESAPKLCACGAPPRRQDFDASISCSQVVHPKPGPCPYVCGVTPRQLRVHVAGAACAQLLPLNSCKSETQRFLSYAVFQTLCELSCECPFRLELPRHCRGPTVLETGGVLPRCWYQCFHRSHVLGPAVLRGPSTQLDLSQVCRIFMNSHDCMQSRCDRLQHLGCEGLAYFSNYRSPTQQHACGASPRHRSRASRLLRHRCSGDLREGGTSSKQGLGLESACGVVPRMMLSAGIHLGCYWQDRSCNYQYVSYFAACGTPSRWPHMLTNVSGGFRVSKILSRPGSSSGGVPPQRHQNPWSCCCPGRSPTAPLSIYGPEPRICACGVLPRRQGQQFGWHQCPGDFQRRRHSSSRPGRPQALLSLPRESGSQTASLNNRHHCSGGQCSPKRWDKYYSKATLTLSISHRVSLFQVPCQHVRDRQQQPAIPEALETQSQEKCPATEGLLTLAECHGQRRNRGCGAAAAPQLQLAARAPTTRARSPAWQRLSHEHVPSLDPRSRSLNQLLPAAAPARIPVIWSARPARKRIPEGSSTRLQLPRRWGGTRRITPRCRSLIFACLFFSFVLLQIGTSSGHLSTHLLYASLRSEPRSAAPVSAVRCWCGRPGAARATLCCFTNARLGHDPQAGALQGFMCQLLACAVSFRLLLGLWFYGGCTLCIQVPLLLSEHVFTSPMQLQPYPPRWLDCLNMVCRSLCCHFRLLVSRCALQVATKSGKGRHTRRFCLLLCLCLSLVGLVPGMFSSHPGAFWRAPARPRHQQYDCMSLRSARPWLLDPTTHSLVLAEGAVAFGPNTVFQRFLFFGESGAMGHSRRSQATKNSISQSAREERASMHSDDDKLTASAKCAARKPLDRRFDAPTFPPPPPPPPPLGGIVLDMWHHRRTCWHLGTEIWLIAPRARRRAQNHIPSLPKHSLMH